MKNIKINRKRKGKLTDEEKYKKEAAIKLIEETEWRMKKLRTTELEQEALIKNSKTDEEFETNILILKWVWSAIERL